MLRKGSLLVRSELSINGEDGIYLLGFQVEEVVAVRKAGDSRMD